jgi:hypothetical protein
MNSEVAEYGRAKRSSSSKALLFWTKLESLILQALQLLNSCPRLPSNEPFENNPFGLWQSWRSEIHCPIKQPRPAELGCQADRTTFFHQ